MSAYGAISLEFGDGEHRFNVAPYAQIFELQDKCGITAVGGDDSRILIPSGPKEIYDRLRIGSWRVADYRETIRIGRIGGGATPVEALQFVKRYVDDRPFTESVEAAWRILAAALVGPPGDDLGKPEAERGQSKVEGASTSPAPPPTAPAPPSGTRPARSTRSPRGNSRPR
jgi:hypothetical protein